MNDNDANRRWLMLALCFATRVGLGFQFQTLGSVADPLARDVAGRALTRGFDRGRPVADKQFFYLPFEHSEHLPDQEHCCALFATTGDAELLKWAQLHADIIRRFGRFPHRNKVLGRETTPEEQAFLDGGGFAG